METTALTRSLDEESLARASRASLAIPSIVAMPRDLVGAIAPSANVRRSGSDPSHEAVESESPLARAAEIGAVTIERELFARAEAIRSEATLAERFVSFADAVERLADRSSGFEERLRLIEKADDLAGAIRFAARRWASLRRSVGARIVDEVERANALLVAAERLSSTGAIGDREPTACSAIGELAGVLSISLGATPTGTTALRSRDGIELLGDRRRARLEVIGLAGDAELEIWARATDESRVQLSQPFGGAIGALVKLREHELASWSGTLERFAKALRVGVNDMHAHPAARDLDGHAAGDVFCGSSAADFAVAVAGPRGLGAARLPVHCLTTLRALLHQLGERPVVKSHDGRGG